MLDSGRWVQLRLPAPLAARRSVQLNGGRGAPVRLAYRGPKVCTILSQFRRPVMRKMIVVLSAGLLLPASAGAAEAEWSVGRWIAEYRPGWVFPKKLPSAP